MTDFEPITQRFPGDCQQCCLAMFLGVAYEDVAKHCWGSELIQGLAPGRDRFIAALFDVQIVERDSSKIRWSEPAVLTLPSLNEPDGSRHVVYWDGARVWDPNQGIPGKKTYTNQRALELATEGYQRAPGEKSE